jgi:hypothetical protein
MFGGTDPDLQPVRSHGRYTATVPGATTRKRADARSDIGRERILSSDLSSRGTSNDKNLTR